MGLLLLVALGLAATPAPAPGAAHPTPVTSPDVGSWLNAHPDIAAALRWENPNGVSTPYHHWPAPMRARLAELTARIGRGEAPGLPEAPPLLRSSDPAAPFPPLMPEWARWSLDVARDTYLAYAAQSLAVEIGRWVPWSMTADPPATLALLLDSRSLFRAEAASGSYRIPYDFGATTPGDPYRVYQFLRANQLIGPTTRDTIERLVAWTGRNVVHFQGDWDAANVYANWQYYGWPPLERVIGGTVDTAHPERGTARRSGACFGTVGFLRLVLRTVNIPVELLHPCPGHAIPHFVREHLYLSHGDDPYSTLLIATPPIPPAALLIDDAQYGRWFGSDEVSIAQCKNIGRQVLELAIAHLPNEFLVRRCADRASGAARERSQVYEPFRFNYSVAQLDTIRLWERLDEKIDASGGCAKVPRAHR
jgi:hypothetical protein